MVSSYYYWYNNFSRSAERSELLIKSASAVPEETKVQNTKAVYTRNTIFAVTREGKEFLANTMQLSNFWERRQTGLLKWYRWTRWFNVGFFFSPDNHIHPISVCIFFVFVALSCFSFDNEIAACQRSPHSLVPWPNYWHPPVQIQTKQTIQAWVLSLLGVWNLVIQANMRRSNWKVWWKTVGYYVKKLDHRFN